MQEAKEHLDVKTNTPTVKIRLIAAASINHFLAVSAWMYAVKLVERWITLNLAEANPHALMNFPIAVIL